jgi:hypothetical protein
MNRRHSYAIGTLHNPDGHEEGRAIVEVGGTFAFRRPYVVNTPEEMRALFGYRLESVQPPVTLYGELADKARAASVALKVTS